MSIDIQSYARKGLEAELVRLDAERERVVAILVSLKAGSALTAGGQEPAPVKRTRQMSEAGRQAIREAVQRRWARVRAEAGGKGASTDDVQMARAARAAKGDTSPRRGRPSSGNRKK